MLNIEERALAYIKKNGNALTIDFNMTERGGGWCGPAAKVLVLNASPGKPANQDDFQLLESGALNIYLHKELVPSVKEQSVKVVHSKFLLWERLEVHGLSYLSQTTWKEVVFSFIACIYSCPNGIGKNNNRVGVSVL